MEHGAGASSLLGIDDAAGADRKHGLSLRKAGRVVDLADTRLALALAEVEPRLAGVADDVPADRRDLRPHVRAGAASGGGLHLVCDDDGHAVLVGDALQLPQEAVQRLLPLRQLVAADVVGAEEARGAVHDQQCVAGLAEDPAHLGEELLLVLGVVRAGVRHVLQDVLLVEAVSACNGDEPLRPERALRVDVESLALRAAVLGRHLAGHAQRMAQLGLAAAELPEDLRDLARLDAAAEEAIQLRGARGQHDHLPPDVQHLRGADHAHGHDLPGRGHDALSLLVADALHLHELPHRHEGDALDAVDAVVDQLLKVRLAEAGSPVRGRRAEPLQPGDAWLVALGLFRLCQLALGARGLGELLLLLRRLLSALLLADPLAAALGLLRHSRTWGT
mmetsp:Transcript_34704/g.107876  ORF Transcript_34704/g.107876 Transcript_34704/m.107876 type:complete len:391 (-) Transcript_34704:51-1223(-)